jgi:hypothetical protein
MIRRPTLPRALTLVAALCLAPLAGAQDPPEAKAAPKAPEAPPALKAPEAPAAAKAPEAPRRGTRPGDVQKVFVLQHVNAGDLVRLLEVFPAQLSYARNSTLQALSVSAAPAVVAAIEETIKRLDVAPVGRSVAITAYVLEGVSEPAAHSDTPPDLDDVIGQLKRTFGFPAFRLADTVIVRAANDSRFEANSGGKKGEAASPTPNTMRGTALILRGEEPRMVRLRSFSFSYNVPVVDKGMTQYRRVGLEADVDIRDGQTVVIGKTGVDAQFLVLRASIVD